MTYRELYQSAKQQLVKAGIDSPAFDALCLFSHCCGMDRRQLTVRGNEVASEIETASYQALLMRRAQGEPLQYLLGEWEFMGMPFLVGKGVLIPRDDTQVLVKESVRLLQGISHPQILDLCGGSGAVAIGIASLLPNAQVCSLELSEEALAYLRRNIQRNGTSRVTARQGDMLREHSRFGEESLDGLVSNPPYIPTGDLAGLQKEVQREPRLALDGGTDGLLFYRVMAEHWLSKLKPGGIVAVEVGIHQADEVLLLFQQAGMEALTKVRDLGGIDRVVSGRKPKKLPN